MIIACIYDNIVLKVKNINPFRNKKREKWMISLATVFTAIMIPVSSVSAVSNIQCDAADIQNQRSCLHNYIQCTLQKHEKNGAGCICYTYRAKRCTNCRAVVIGSLQEKESYAKCPH